MIAKVVFVMLLAVAVAIAGCDCPKRHDPSGASTSLTRSAAEETSLEDPLCVAVRTILMTPILIGAYLIHIVSGGLLEPLPRS
jgi:hypothetical protein